MRIDIVPMGAVRMTQRGKWNNPNALRYLNYKQEIAYRLHQSFYTPRTDAVSIKVTFYMPIPQSWSKRKRSASDGMPCMVKPDIDNMIKGVFDAANGVIWKDDNQVVKVESQKIYSFAPGIEIQVEAISSEHAA